MTQRVHQLLSSVDDNTTINYQGQDTNMDSAGDKYIETVEYVKHCDALLERIRCLSEQLEKDCSSFNGHDDTNANNNDDKFFETEQFEENGKSSIYSSDNMSNKLSPTRPTELASNIDKITNYRYSFYENSNKISIYVASSLVITQAVSFFIDTKINIHNI